MNIFLIVFLILPTLCSLQNTKSVTGPKDSTVLSGGDIILECRATFDSDILIWENNKGDKVWNSNKGLLGDSSKYDVKREGDRYDLKIKNVNWRDGGLYECFLASEQTGVKSKLIVVDSPMMSAQPDKLIENKRVTAKCTVMFGAPAYLKDTDVNPSVELHLGGKRVAETFSLKEIGIPNDKAYMIELMHNVTILAEHKYAECIFKTQKPSYQIRSNQTVDIHFRPKVPKVNPLGVDVKHYIGDVLNCTAEGFPEPTIEFKSMIQGRPGSLTSYLILTKQHAGQNKYKCIASNVPDEKPERSELEFEFFVADSTRPSLSTASIMGGFANFIMLIICVMFISRIYL